MIGGCPYCHPEQHPVLPLRGGIPTHPLQPEGLPFAYACRGMMKALEHGRLLGRLVVMFDGTGQ